MYRRIGARRWFGTLLFVMMANSVRADELVLIVHPSREVKLTLSDIAAIYLKQRRFWDDRTVIVPLNREAGSAEREVFSREVFNAESRTLVTYWNRAYFRGVLPPPTFASDEAVRRFVASEPRAVGYIPAHLVDASVRVVFRFETRVD
jgi:hypothetical protein